MPCFSFKDAFVISATGGDRGDGWAGIGVGCGLARGAWRDFCAGNCDSRVES